MSQSKTTTDHEAIKSWAEERGGSPARVKDTDGLLRIDFGETDESLERISWDEFFDVFDSRNIAFLYQEETEGGEQSRFFKFVDREG